MPTARSDAEHLFFEGNRLLAAGETAAAATAFSQAVALVPDLAEAWSNLALMHERAGDDASAEPCHRRAILALPDNLSIVLNLGAFLLRRKCLDEAQTLLRGAVAAAPDAAPAWSMLGAVLTCLKQPDRAEPCFRHALALDPDYRKARFNLAYGLLRQGRLTEGFAALEARDGYQRLATHFTCARWSGEPLAGKSIIIGFEGGHGDMIQFCRYGAVLKAMGAAHLSLVCHPALTSLLRSLAGVDRVFSFEQDVPRSGWDFWIPPLSLPHFCGTGLDTIPAVIPYLQPDPTRVAHWQARLPVTGMKVGLAWKGNPRFENDADRSLPALDILAPLGRVAGVQFVSLQKGPGEEQASSPPAGLTLLALGQDFDDFEDCAAVIAGLDLVISVDSAVAHLAGSMGVPCWLLLPDYQTDWRWMTERTDSPWYPQHMRLFRQRPGAEGWAAVIDEVVLALALHATEVARIKQAKVALND
ncbi:Flp pilus assembly protein TadD [Actimicrobium sp. GrIS 1.19]|uniref:tetratricopeptide repeat protein n=1 Tax=Actimicrobium sp. GrIS 1.19 TaxID=3071708 RepID=UPI002E0C419D|nr:Flp pilus assembly protein TadD [Actimicrobium sp. GrIS 1.19]